MGSETRSKLNNIAKLNNLSVKFGKVRERAAERNRWLETRRDLDALCGAESADNAEMMALLIESRLAKEEGKSDPLSSEMALLKRPKFRR